MYIVPQNCFCVNKIIEMNRLVAKWAHSLCHNGNDMTSYQLFLWLSVFVATTVEMVEALTIILALGITRGWRTALIATGAAIVTLAVVVAIFYSIFARVTGEGNVPIMPLWALVGGLLLIFGLQWMKKAILRIGGVLESRDEEKIYKRLTASAKKAPKSKKDSIDWYSFVLVFKGVLLEGFEVVFIVIIFGSARGEIGIGIGASLAALLFVALLGVVIHKPLSRVPESWMKLTVGILLTTFGTYFGSEGVGIIWPLGEWALL
ncbi:MAG: hypothetical protein JWO07_418 [Candidatus Saccharibacteria bacterium]|nr:hypothetical protein [Candidatus Saccharibacteria bacterium]